MDETGLVIFFLNWTHLRLIACEKETKTKLEILIFLFLTTEIQKTVQQLYAWNVKVYKSDN